MAPSVASSARRQRAVPIIGAKSCAPVGTPDTARKTRHQDKGSAKKCGAIRQRMPRSRVSCPVHGSGGTLLTLENCLSTTVSITLSTIPVEAPDCHSGVGAVCGSCGHISARIRHCPTLFGTPVDHLGRWNQGEIHILVSCRQLPIISHFVNFGAVPLLDETALVAGAPPTGGISPVSARNGGTR